MPAIDPNEHVLKQLVFPDRYESLVERLGSEVAKLLVTPERATQEWVEEAAYGINSRREGCLAPIVAPSGTGKTTLANNLSTFYPRIYTSTIQYNGDVSSQALRAKVEEFVAKIPVNDDRVIPINIDHREGSPPIDSEMAELKRFMRSPHIGARCLVLWPDTSSVVAEKIAAEYEQIAGSPVVGIPLYVAGPPRESWQATASSTLRLSNQLDSLEDLGVDPKDYDPAAFPSIGAFLRTLSDHFRKLRLQLLRAVQRPLRLGIVFVSKSNDAGVLVHLTGSTRFGLLDGNALLDATKTSEVGRWWADRPGLLTQTIVRLDARAFSLPPTASIGVLRRFGNEDTISTLTTMGIHSKSEERIRRDLERSDLGKYLLGQSRPTYEVRGTPSTTSISAFELLGELGFTYGVDKKLNIAMSDAIAAFLAAHEMKATVQSERKLPFCPLIPDNSIDTEDDVICLEYTWRAADYLTPKNRSEIAQYCLGKLRNYARELGWVRD